MSNLGLYQWIVTIAKKSGGPEKFIEAVYETGKDNGRVEAILFVAVIGGLAYGSYKLYKFVNDETPLDCDKEKISSTAVGVTNELNIKKE